MVHLSPADIAFHIHPWARFRPTEAPEGRYKLHAHICTGVLPQAPHTLNSPPACRGNYHTED